MTAPHWTEPGPTPVRLPSGVLSVDPERIEGLIGRLNGVVDEVLELEDSLAAFLSVSPPGQDEVSRNAARQASVMMERGQTYLTSWRNQLLLTKQALEWQLAAYRAADRAARA